MTTEKPIRCITIGKSTLQGLCEIETIHSHQHGPQPTGRGTIDGIAGRLVPAYRKGERHD